MAHFLLMTVLLPMALAASCALALLRLGHGRGTGLGLHSGATLGLGAGWIGSHLAIRGLPPVPPLDVMDWLPFVSAAALVLGLFESAWPMNRWTRLVLNGVLILGLLGLTLRPMAQHTWTSGQTAVQFVALGLLVAASWWNLARLAKRLPAWATASILLMTFLTLALIQAAFSGNAVLGQLALGFAASLAGVGLVASWRRPSHLGLGAAAVSTMALAGSVLNGQVYGNLAAGPAVVLLFAPAGAWLGVLTPFRRSVRIVLGALGPIVLLAFALVFAYRAAPADEPAGDVSSVEVSPIMGQTIVQVDAFSDRPFGGNPAAVCVGTAPFSVAWMQRLAAEMNLSETAFLHPEGGPGTYRLRWFTPTAEVDLCGHATLASAHVLWNSGHLPPDRTARFLTRSGQLTATRVDGWIRLNFPAIAAHPEPPADGLLEALGVTPIWVGRAGDDWLIQVDSAEAVLAVTPDFGTLKRIVARGFCVTAPGDGREADFVSRFFAPGLGIDEDPVTGSAHCVLGPYWAARLGKARLTGIQLSRRRGEVRVEVLGDRVALEGRAVTIFKADLDESALDPGDV